MLNFDYQNRTRIVFGKGTQRGVGALIKPYSDKVLLHYGGGSVKKSGLYDEVLASLRESGLQVVELGGVRPNPRLSLVREGIELCRREKIGFILAAGGGSVIDSAKAIALGALYPGDVWDIFTKLLPVEKALPVGCILTLPATGSESSISVVISNEADGRKLGYNYHSARPQFGVINPELFTTLPPEQIANGVCDIMSHVIERYITNTLRTDVVDGLCESLLRSVMRNGLRLKKDRLDYDAWAEIALAGALAHNGLLGVGRQEDWASHKIEHELSALYDVAHGAGLAVIMPAWMRYVYKSNPQMFMQFALRVMGVDSGLREPEKVALEGVARLEEFFVSMGLPLTLHGLGIPPEGLTEEKLELMAKKATKIAYGQEMPLGGLQKLVWKDVLAIYKSCL